MNITEPEESPVVKAADRAVKIANVLFEAQADRIRKANLKMTKEQAFEAAYMAPENASLRRTEHNMRMAAIGSENRISEPLNKSATDGKYVYALAKQLAENAHKSDPAHSYAHHFENAMTEVAKGLLPGFARTEPVDIGEFNEGLPANASAYDKLMALADAERARFPI